MPEPQSSDGAISPAGTGGPMDLALEEGASLEKNPGGPDGTGPSGKPRSLWSDAWRDLRRNPVFIISALVILFLVVISIWPGLIASGDPLQANLDDAQKGSEPGHPFGFDPQGRDVYTRVVHGTRTSVTVGVCATLGVAILGSVLGGLAGFFGGWWDSILSASPTSSSASPSSSAAWSSSPSSPAPPSGPSSASSSCSAGPRSPASPAARSSPPNRTTTCRRPAPSAPPTPG
ncbi:hypothetical protein SCALM49S_00227 [Streptomyces californicus]